MSLLKPLEKATGPSWSPSARVLKLQWAEPPTLMAQATQSNRFRGNRMSDWLSQTIKRKHVLHELVLTLPTISKYNTAVSCRPVLARTILAYKTGEALC